MLMAFSKKSCAAVIAAAVTMISSAAFAGSIDYLSNQSADYIRMFSRNGATEGADIAMYNPAGTAYLKDGFYSQLSYQAIFKHYNADMNAGTSYDGDYKTDLPTYCLPGAFAIYKKNNWSGFLTATVLGGGGSVDFKNGIPKYAFSAISASQIYTGAKYTDGNLKATSLYPQLTLGGSYALNDLVSVSLGVRGVYGYKTYKGKMTINIPTSLTTSINKTSSLDAKETAFGVGGVIGAEVRPAKDLAVTARFETPVKLDFKTEVKNNDNATYGLNSTFQDGKTRRKDMPAMMGLGASYVLFDRVTAIASFDGFFIGLSDQKKDNASKGLYNDGYDDDYDSFGWEASLGFDVAVIPSFLKLSAGYMYNKVGGNKNTYNDFDYALDSHNFGVGGKLTPVSNVDVTLGLSTSRYIDGKSNIEPGVTYKKYNYIVGASVEYRVQ
jgi:long-chain fatty acid transport protein